MMIIHTFLAQDSADVHRPGRDVNLGRLIILTWKELYFTLEKG